MSKSSWIYQVFCIEFPNYLCIQKYVNQDIALSSELKIVVGQDSYTVLYISNDVAEIAVTRVF